MLYKIIQNKVYEGRVYLPKDLSAASMHEAFSFTKICAGLKECAVQTFIRPSLKSDEIEISSDVLSMLSIPGDLPYQIKFVENSLILGPVIGLLLDYANKDLTERQLKNYLPYTLLYEKTGGLIIVFSSEGINFDDKAIEGFYYKPEESQWVKAVLPFPQAIFRRIFLADDTIEKLQSLTGGRMFNNHYFSKWKFWSVASRYPSLAEYLPNTKLLTSISDIDEMFKSFDSLFLKPIHGTLGIGLVRIQKQNDLYIFKEKDLNKPVLTLNKEEASKFISDMMSRNSYIIQQNIDLLKFEDRYSDFRVIMQKDNTLNWKCTGIVVSMGAPGGLCSNYQESSSRYLSFENFFLTYLSLSGKEIQAKKCEIIELCKKVCNVLDLEMGNYGDVGIDVGLDVSLKPWVFEVNERHYHLMPMLIDDRQTYSKIKRNAVKYLVALSGFNLI